MRENVRIVFEINAKMDKKATTQPTFADSIDTYVQPILQSTKIFLRRFQTNRTRESLDDVPGGHEGVSLVSRPSFEFHYQTPKWSGFLEFLIFKKI